MFDPDRFIADCLAAIEDGEPPRALREVVTRAVADPDAVIRGLGAPQRAGVAKLYHSDRLTILNLAWGPGMTIMPHDHRMAAVIGLYSGREDNIFWRRIATEDGPQLEAAGARSIGPRDCVTLGRDIVHSVTNPLDRITGAIHVYLGDFFGAERSEWEPETLTEKRYDAQKAMAMFEASNRRLEHH